MFVGMDSHKDTLAISGVDAAGRQQQAQVFPNTREGHRRLVAWLQAQSGVVRVGIEGAGGYGRAVAIHLVQAGLVVVEVTPSLTVRERRRLRQRGKADPTDALAIARVVAREQDLPAVRGQDLAEDLRLLVDYREQLLGERTRIANRVHADLVALQPGYQHQLPELRSQRAAGLVRRLLAGQVGCAPSWCVAGWTSWTAWTPRSGSSSDGSGTWSRRPARHWSRSMASAHWSPRGSLGRWVTCAALPTGTSSPRPTALPRSRPPQAASSGIG